MFHELATDKTKELVEQYPEFKKYLSELHYAFKLRILTHNNTELERVKDNYVSDNEERKAKHIRNHLYFLMTFDNGIPVGVATMADGSDKQGKITPMYQFICPSIRKERGRGMDRCMRESINLPAFIKLLRKDFAARPLDNLKDVGWNLYANAQANVASRMSIRYRGLHMNNETVGALVNYFLSNTMITDDSLLKDIERYKKDNDASESERAVQQEHVDQFKGNVRFIMQFDECPMIVGRAKWVESKEGRMDGYYEFHPDVKCYLSPDHVPQEYAQMMVDYKMYNIKHENLNDAREIEKNTQFKVLPITGDRYDPDLGITAAFNSMDSMPPQFKYWRALVVPEMEIPNGN